MTSDLPNRHRSSSPSILCRTAANSRWWRCGLFAAAAALAVGTAIIGGCGSRDSEDSVADGEGMGVTTASDGSGGGGGAVGDVAAKVAGERNLTPDDVRAALKTYMPSGRHDDYVMFASGGHSGQIFAIGVPSMRLLRSIAVFTPDPWQGYGFGVGNDILAKGSPHPDEPITHGDTHHPALSQTNGDYDGEFLFINDKANARIGVIDLRDWETKQIIKNPLLHDDHGSTMVTPNTEYIVEGSQYATPWGENYAPIEQYKEKFRGLVTAWKFDRKAGRIDASQSFSIELPPYWQDLFSSGKGVSDGWIFGNSFNVEQATGGIEEGKPPFEAGVSQRDTDYMHVVNLKKAEAVFKAGKFEKVQGMPVISMKTAIEEGLLYFIPENKSPHGCDVAPGGEYVIVSGKLDPHVTVYSFEKIQQAIAAKNYKPDEYGVPVLDMDACTEARVEVGLGPLHCQFDPKGYVYTSLFLDSAVARWTLGGNYAKLHPEQPWTVVAKTTVQYNVGHICAAGGDTAHPDGKYLVSLNKWSVDRYVTTGPLLPQNLQLLDIGQGGDKMPVIADLPLGVGEPHYAEMIAATKLKPWTVYPEVGWDAEKQAVDANAPQAGKERVVRNGNKVEIFMTAVRSHLNPEHIKLKVGDKVTWHITSTERAQDAVHGFTISSSNISLSIEPGKTVTFEFEPKHPGVFPYYCTEFCSALHLEMMGYMFVEPAPNVASASAEASPETAK